MALKSIRPLTPGQRLLVRNSQTHLAENNPEKSLTGFRHCAKGRNNNGRITSRRRGGGHKKLYRQIDFRRARIDVPATVITLEYDPNRSAHIALIQYQDGEKSYILAPDGLKVGDTVVSTNKVVDKFDVGQSLPLKNIAPATFIHAIEMAPGAGAQIAAPQASTPSSWASKATAPSSRCPPASSVTSTPNAAPPSASCRTSTTTTSPSARPAATAGSVVAPAFAAW